MATKKKTSQKTAAQKKGAKRTKKETAAQSKEPQRRRLPGEESRGGGDILDNNARRDIAGVCLIVLGVVLMVIMCLPSSDAVFNGIVSTGMHYFFGIGCYVLPIFVAIMGISYLIKPKRLHMSARIAVGLLIIFVALLGIFAMFAPVQAMGQDNVGALFDDANLVNYGGYIGSAITWAGITAMGRLIMGILLAALVIIGLITIGFSISGSIETAKLKKESSEPLAPHRHRDKTSGFARVRVQQDRDVDVDDIYRQMDGVGRSRNFDPNRTAVFGGSNDHYSDLPDPEFMKNLYPDEDDTQMMSARLDAPERTENNTRRLVPIVRANEDFDYEDDAPMPFEALPEEDERRRFPDRPYDDVASHGNIPDLGMASKAKADLPLIEEESQSSYAPDKDSMRDDINEVLRSSFPDDESKPSLLNRPNYLDSEYAKSLIKTYESAYNEAFSDTYEDPFSEDVDPFGAPLENELDDLLDPKDPRSSLSAIPDPSADYDDMYRDIYIDGTKTLSVKIDEEPHSITLPDLEPAPERIRPKPRVIDDETVPDDFEEDFNDDDEIIAPEPVPIALPAKKAPSKSRTKKPKSASKASKPKSTSGFKLPSMSLLQKAPKTKKRSDKDLKSVADTLQKTLSDFGVAAEVVDWIAGPTVTLFEVNLPAGVRVSRVTALNDDIALALAAPGIRIFAPVPGTNYVGIEVPNAMRETVYLSDVLGNAGDGPLEIAIGKDVEGHAIVSDLAKMPHLLIGGTTGSGKSVAINAMIMSILMRCTPDEVRFILVDPKRVEFTPYNGIPHLYVPVVTEPKEAASALSWGVAEMERRLKIFSGVGARNITQYNDKARRNNEQIDPSAKDSDDENEQMEVMPYIVIVIDELADLMMNVGKDVEVSISRIAQLARAAGIHLIVATQRPSTNVVTGLIKANITNRIAFNVASSIDSRVILDSTGAENLIGLGDLLLSKPELAKPQRIQACYVSESEIESVVDHIKEQGSPEYHTEILNTNTYSVADSNPQGGSSSNMDPLVWEAAGIVVSSKMGSTSNLQRRLKVGYARAGRIMDQLEELGIVGTANGSKPRDVLVDEAELELIKDLEQAD